MMEDLHPSILHLHSSILDPVTCSMRLSKKITAFVRSARVAHLATVAGDGQPLVIPICFAFNGKEFFSPIDEKPKQTSPHKLKRLRNIAENPKVSLVIDHYDEDWQRLAYVLITGTANILFRGPSHRKAVTLLRTKYRQYQSMAIEQRPMIVITPLAVKTWGNF